MNQAIVFLFCFLNAFLLGAQTNISTIAGNGNQGQADGPALSATFFRTIHAIEDSKGNVFIADYDNHCIRKLDTNGIVTTFVGSKGVLGFLDGQGSLARFYRPFYMVIDGADNIYLADAKNHAIRKITPSGLVSTIAGNGNVGSVDGIGAAATFNHPYGICFDLSGNLMITDRFSHKIRKVNVTTGQVTTYSGFSGAGFQNGNVATARFNAPHGITHDGSGNFFVADRDNAVIRKIDASGNVSTYAGSGSIGFSDGNSANATFDLPSGIDIDIHGDIYVADYRNHAIRKISGNQVVTIAGNGFAGFQDGPALGNTMRNPHGIWVSDDPCPRILVADHFNHAVREVITSVQFEPDSLSFCQQGGMIGAPLGATNILWNTGLQSDSIYVQSSGTYTVSGLLGSCTFTQVFYVEVPSISLTSISVNEVICSGENVFVQIPPAPNQAIFWFDGSTATQRSFSTSGIYWVTRSIPCDTITDTIQVTVINCDTIPQDTVSRLFIPNAFTPNGDMNNDFFYVRGTGINNYRIMIFNRWGSLVFESTDLNEPWDGTYRGTTVADGVYVYRITYRTYNQKYREENGMVTVFR